VHAVTPFSRTDTSLLGRWWWTVDRWMLTAVLLLMLVGAALALAASPAAAERIGLDSFHFARQQLLFLPVALIVMLGVSLMSRTGVQRIGVAGTALSIALLALTLIVGLELNGARRWLPLGGFHLQPSEFVKPCLAVFMAAVLARSREEQLPYGKLVASVPVILAALLLVLQPDIGMATTVAAVWFVQMFVAGMPLALAVLGGAATAGGLLFAYHNLAHVKSRIDQFIDPTTGDTYQVDTSLRAFEVGGLFGRGPGEGTVKNVLPDAHTDFIFAVAAEEFGVIACIVVVALFGFIVLRGFARAMRDGDLFSLIAVTGLLAQFGFQALINMGVAIRLLPAKGMTLPFLSYGGSSTMATAIGLGMVLALTRERRNGEGYAP
jgi:cell division protein FtsW